MTQTEADKGALSAGGDVTGLFDPVLIPVIRRLGDRTRGGAVPLPEDRRNARDLFWQGLAQAGVLRLGPRSERIRAVLPIAESMGAALCRTPFFDTVMAAEVIEAALEPAWRSRLLPLIAEGGVTVAAAVRCDATSPAAPGPLSLGAGGRISAVRRFVEFGADADLIMVVGRTGSDTVAAFLRSGGEGSIARRHDELGRGDFHYLRFDEATPLCHLVLADWDGVVARARLRHAGYLCGLCQGALALVIDRMKERKLFGQTLAKMQGPAFRIAEFSARLEAVRSYVYASGDRADQGNDVTLVAVQCLLTVSELACDLTAEVLQLHGAYGLSETSDAQLFYRRAYVDAMTYGTRHELRREAGRRWRDLSGTGWESAT